MTTREQIVLVISDDAALCAEARRELQTQGEGLRVASVSSVEAAQRIVADAPPAVIVLEKASAGCSKDGRQGKQPRLDAVVSSLAASARVVGRGPEQCPG